AHAVNVSDFPSRTPKFPTSLVRVCTDMEVPFACDHSRTPSRDSAYPALPGPGGFLPRGRIFPWFQASHRATRRKKCQRRRRISKTSASHEHPEDVDGGGRRRGSPTCPMYV